MVFVVCKVSADGKTVKNWYGKSVSDNIALRDLYNEVAAGQFDDTHVALDRHYNNGMVTVCVGKHSQENGVQVSGEEIVGTVTGALGLYIHFVVQNTHDIQQNVNSDQQNAFEMLMSASRSTSHLPKKWNEVNSKFKLKNAIIELLSQNGLGWSAANVEHLGVEFVNVISDTLWSIDGNHKTIASRGFEIPLLFDKFQGYNAPEKRKRRKLDTWALSSSALHSHASALFQLTSQAYMKLEKWRSMCGFVLGLATTLHKYADYLDDKRRKTEETHEKVKQLQNERETWEVLQATVNIQPGLAARYFALHDALHKSPPFTVISVADFCPGEPWKKHRFLKEMVVPVKCTRYTYSTGRGNLTFLWSVPVGETEDSVLSQNMKIRGLLSAQLPMYHTRAMRREFIQSFGTVTGVKSMFLREMYRRLSGDASAARTSDESDIDNKIKELIETEDPDLIVDLRVNNEGRPERYTEFLEECRRYIDGTIETAVNDRRHDHVAQDGSVITHLAKLLSAEDLHRQVSARVPEGTSIPSVQWLRIQFWPRRMNAATARYYSGKLNVKYMVQARQFRATHEDCHYASALFRYQKEFAVQNRENLNFVCMDDKHSIKVGEPGYPLAAVERGRQVLVGLGQSLQVGDHDFSKISLIPSVSLQIQIPTSIEGSWYDGQVFVGLKEHCFESSSALRHATELDKHVLREDTKPLLALYTDGGPDHKVNQLSVQLSLVCLFLKRDLDMLIAVRTPPYNSWKDPAERVMSILNLAQQAVGMMRSTTNCEDLLSNASNMKSVRALAEQNAEVELEVLQSVQPCKTLLRSLYERLCLKGKHFRTYDAATKDDLDEMWAFLARIDPTVTRQDTTKAVLKSKPQLKAFLDSHCRCRHYMFSIKKCADANCEFHGPPRLAVETFDQLHHLPDPVPTGERYQAFDKIYGTDTTEEYRPSLASKTAKGHGFPFNPSAQTAKNVKVLVQCGECHKWRVIHAQRKLQPSEVAEVQTLLETLDYSCGSVFVDLMPQSDAEESLMGRIFVRRSLTCRDPTENTYYSAGYEDICFHCGTEEHIAVNANEYPICHDCRANGLKAQKRRTRVSKQRSVETEED